MSDSILRDYISDLYRGILMREPDEDGLNSHLEKNFSACSLDDAYNLLKIFINSDERIRQVEDLKAKVAVNLKIDSIAGCRRVISIGSHCATAGTLQRLNLKKASYPFDWMFSNLGMVSDCIEDDFSTFMDRKYHKHIPVGEREHENSNFCDHTYFLEKYAIKYVFNHTDISSSQGRAYYERCVSRFRQVGPVGPKLRFWPG